MFQRLIVLVFLYGDTIATPANNFLPILPQLDGRIIGGSDANIEDYPYQVSVQAFDSHLCGGSIINNRYVISAAHCIIYQTSRYSIRAGSSYRNSGGVTVAVNNIFVHPSFNESSYEYDISILQLASELTFSSAIAPIALPSEGQKIEIGANSVVTGWGDVIAGSNTGSLLLQSVTVPTISQDECRSSYGTRITESMLCAGFPEGGKDACQGDSGGPLASNGQLIGIVSWGRGCALPNFPGVYADVPYLRSYIAQIVGF